MERSTARETPKLWFEGVNYTADAVVIDPGAQKILLIQRSDCGEWALPGGFVDATDASPLATAVRELKEESNLELSESGHLIYSGIVDDPRNSEVAWIETSAYLFETISNAAVNGSDDALAAQWHDLADLPSLYASHRQIIDCVFKPSDDASD